MTNPGRAIQCKIRRVLMEHWDPIGINDVPECADEYDSYIGVIYKLLNGRASDEEIADYLNHIETEWMGLGRWERRDQLLNVAQHLRRLDITLP